MKEDNNFKKVYEKEAPAKLRESSLKNAQGSVSTMRSIFSVLDLYISKFFGAIIHSLKDNSTNGISTNTGFAFGMEKEKPADGKGKGKDDRNEEDWASDEDLPDDLRKS